MHRPAATLTHLAQLRWLFDRRTAERELDEELRFHLEMEVERYRAQGLSRRAAYRAARLSFGNVEAVKEECRDQRRAHALESWWQDVRYSFRALRRNPGYALAVIVTLALGLGANAAVFSVLHGVLLKPLPYEGGDRLVVVQQTLPSKNVANMGFSPLEVQDYRRRGSDVLEGFVEYHRMWFNLLGRGEPLRVQTGVVSHEYFQVLGLKPWLGRTFTAADEDPAAEPVLVLGHAFWRDKMDGSRQVIGEEFEMNDRTHTVVGVLPPVPHYPETNDVYMPTSACPFRSNPQRVAARSQRGLVVLARLQAGVSRSRAESDLNGVAERLRQAHGEAAPEAASEIRLVPLRDVLTREARPTLFLLLGTVTLVLLIACANVAGLSLARLAGRRRELGLRTALGAGRGRLLRQMLTESSILGLVGGAVGLLLALVLVDVLVAFVARFTERAPEVQVDVVVVLFTVALSLVAGLGFGAVAALQRAGSSPVLERHGASRRHLRRWLVVGQLAVAVVLLAGAGLLVRSLINLNRVDPGFDCAGVLTARLDLDWSRYDPHPERAAFHERLLRELETTPGVVAAALSSEIPLAEQLAQALEIRLEGDRTAPTEPQPRSRLQAVSGGYFDTLSIERLEGRTFKDLDDAQAPPVAVVNASLARRHWGSRSPLGRRISIDDGKTWSTIVGVVADVRHFDLASPGGDVLYLPMAQVPRLSSRLLVRTAGEPMAARGVVQEAVYGLDPRQPLAHFRALEQVRREAVASPRLTATLLSLFAVLALAIAATGMGGLLAYSVSRRTREIGVRMALGAARGNVLALVLRQGLALVALGLGLGLVGTLPVTRLLSELLYGVQPTDPFTFGAVALILLAVATLSAWIPARRATAIDPMRTLRCD